MAATLIPYIPDWLLFLIIGIILLIIYIKLPSQLKKSTKNFIFAYGIYVVLLIILIYGWNKWGTVADHPEVANMKYALFIVLTFLLLYIAARSWLYEMRYNTNHLIADNLQGSCHRYQEVENIGDGVNWVVFFLDGSGSSDNHFVIPWPFSKRIIIVPKVACQFIGNQILVKSNVKKVDWDNQAPEIPEEVMDFIEHDAFGRFCRDEVYIGYFDVEIKATNSKFTDLENILKKKDARINELKAMLDGKIKIMKGYVNETLAITNKFQGKDWRRQQQVQPRSEA